jgi:hypothetical protein
MTTSYVRMKDESTMAPALNQYMTLLKASTAFDNRVNG